MLVGDAGAEPPAWLPYVLGWLIIGVMGSAILLGLRHAARRWRVAVAGWTVGYALVYAALVRAAGAAASADPGPLVGGFPTPTAWLLYGMGLFPWILMGLLVRATAPERGPEAEARFAALLAARGPETHVER